MKALVFIRQLYKKFPLLLVGNTILLVLSSLLDVISVFSLVVIVDIFINPNFTAASPFTKKILLFFQSHAIPVSLSWILAIFLLLNVLKVVFQIFAQFSILKTKYAVLRDVMAGTFEDFFNARWYFFSSSKQGTLLNTFIREMNVVGDAFGAMARYFSGILQIMLYLVVPFYLSWQVTSVSIVITAIFLVPFFLLGKVSYGLGKLNTSTSNQIGTVLQESLNLGKVILGFGNQHKAIAAFKNAFEAHRQVTIKSQTLTYAIPLLFYPFALIVLIIGVFIARSLAMPIAETAVLFYALIRIVPAVTSLAEEKSRLDNFYPSYEQVLELRNRAKSLAQPSGKREFSGFNQELTLKGLSFAYEGKEKILSDINLRIPKGKMVAIVGESGVGKSTLIDMIMAFHEPTSGWISLDNIALKEFKINSFRSRIGYVPQDSVLFNISVKDNLLWANEGASADEIDQACRQANARDFIQSLSNGYDTLVGDRGVRLSGGQVQRIALARAILRKPEILILDEATSSLDSASERLIQQAIEGVAKNTTVIVVAHRLSTIIHADYIYVLKNGRVIEEGTYPELINKQGNFNTMVKLQALSGSERKE
ncbi:MAG: ABC transporter ATP-binding protein [Candidatus Omnitrophica bacterium]|nr:ABC transporter ATP-binding protein [Candidatus Omnitrophota bacterium]